MDSNSNISRKDIKEALVRAALKDDAFRESLLANPKFAVERALGRTPPDRIKVVLLQETDDVMYIVLPKDFPDDTANLSDAELETIAGGFLSTETNVLRSGSHTIRFSSPASEKPKQPKQPNQTPNHMSEETNKPESISDEQLEDVSGGMMDNTITTENCSAALSTINL